MNDDFFDEADGDDVVTEFSVDAVNVQRDYFRSGSSGGDGDSGGGLREQKQKQPAAAAPQRGGAGVSNASMAKFESLSKQTLVEIACS